jgi:hypothetical protein
MPTKCRGLKAHWVPMAAPAACISPSCRPQVPSRARALPTGCISQPLSCQVCLSSCHLPPLVSTIGDSFQVWPLRGGLRMARLLQPGLSLILDSPALMASCPDDSCAGACLCTAQLGYCSKHAAVRAKLRKSPGLCSSPLGPPSCIGTVSPHPSGVI